MGNGSRERVKASHQRDLHLPIIYPFHPTSRCPCYNCFLAGYCFAFCTAVLRCYVSALHLFSISSSFLSRCFVRPLSSLLRPPFPTRDSLDCSALVLGSLASFPSLPPPPASGSLTELLPSLEWRPYVVVMARFVCLSGLLSPLKSLPVSSLRSLVLCSFCASSDLLYLYLRFVYSSYPPAVVLCHHGIISDLVSCIFYRLHSDHISFYPFHRTPSVSPGLLYSYPSACLLLFILLLSSRYLLL